MNIEDQEAPDYLLNERIQLLLKYGYCGFTVQRIDENRQKEEVVVEARHRNGNILTATGDSKEDACRQMIDLIDTSIDDL